MANLLPRLEGLEDVGLPRLPRLSKLSEEEPTIQFPEDEALAGLTPKQRKQLGTAQRQEEKLLRQLEELGEEPSTARRIFGPLLWTARQLSRPFFMTSASLETMFKQIRKGDVNVGRLAKEAKAGFLLEKEVTPGEILAAAGIPKLGTYTMPVIGFEFTGRGLIGLPLWIFADPLTYLPIVGWTAKGVQMSGRGAAKVLPTVLTREAIEAGAYAKNIGNKIFRPGQSMHRGINVAKGKSMETERRFAILTKEIGEEVDVLKKRTGWTEENYQSVLNAVEDSTGDALAKLPENWQGPATELSILKRHMEEQLDLGQVALGKEPVVLGGQFIKAKKVLENKIARRMQRVGAKESRYLSASKKHTFREIASLNTLANRIEKQEATIGDVIDVLKQRKANLSNGLNILKEAGGEMTKRIEMEAKSLSTAIKLLDEVRLPIEFRIPGAPIVFGLKGLKPITIAKNQEKQIFHLVEELDKTLGRVEGMGDMGVAVQNIMMMQLRNVYKDAGIPIPALTGAERALRNMSVATRKKIVNRESLWDRLQVESAAKLVAKEEKIGAATTITVDKYKYTLAELNDAVEKVKGMRYMARVLDPDAAKMVTEKLMRDPKFATRLNKDPRIFHRKMINRESGLPLTLQEANEAIAEVGTKATGYEAFGAGTMAKFFETDPSLIFRHEMQMVGKMHSTAEWAKEIIKNFGVRKGAAIGEGITKELVEVPGVELFKGYLFKPEIAQEITKYNDAVLNPKALGKFLSTYDAVLRWWKAFTLYLFPSYHFRNYGSQVVIARADDVTWADLARAPIIQMLSTLKRPIPSFLKGRLGKGKESLQYYGAKVSDEMADLNMNKILDEALYGGVIDVGFFVEETGVKHLSRTSWNPFSIKGPLIQTGKKFANAVDNSTRLAHFLSALKHPKVHASSVEEAIYNAVQRVRLRQFPYDDIMAISRIERDVVMRIVPFYRWLRFNIPAQIEMAVRNPKKLTGLEKLRVSFEGEERPEHMPDFIRDMVGIKITEDPEGFSRFMTLLNQDPRADLDVLLRPSKFVVSAGVGGPFMSLYEYAVNYNHFVGRELERQDILDAGFRDMHPDSLVQDSLNAALEAAGLDERIGKSELHVMRSWLRALSVIDSIASSLTKKGQVNPFELAALRQAVGIPIFSTDEELEEYYKTIRRVRGERGVLRTLTQPSE